MTTGSVLGAVAYLVPALVWAIIAEDVGRFWLIHRPRRPFYRLIALATTSMACFYFLYIPVTLLLPTVSLTRAPRWFDLTDVFLVFAIACFRHLAWYFRLDVAPPSRTWVLINYGCAGVVGLINLFPEVIPAPTIDQQMSIARAVLMPYTIGMLVLVLRQVRRSARPGGWRPGSPVARYADVIAVSVILAAATLVYVWYAWMTPRVGTAFSAGYVQPPPLLNATVGLLVALPIAVRFIGSVVRRLIFLITVLAVTAIVFFGAHALAATVAAADLRLLIGFLAVAGLVLLLVLGQNALWDAIDRVFFRRGWRQRNELDRFIRTLSPELGALECCRRTAAELVRVMQLRGIAILLSRGRGVVTAGQIKVDPLLRVWNDGAFAQLLPRRPFSLGTFSELPPLFYEALVEAEVVGGMPLVSPRQSWGAAFGTTSPYFIGLDAEDGRALQSLIDQLALILDATELLDRTVAVERSLAHAEKLAAIGELAARIAHEIRNPVTAARSLAQQLRHEPASAESGELSGLILTELERVERQVAALLRFARRDEFRFEVLDLSELVNATIDSFRPRLEAAGIHVAVTTAGDVVARVDREKIRQVLINLVENAMDALANGSAVKQLNVIVTREHDSAVLRVSDSGPGVPASALPQLFEPFFSLKEKGTGLGLAIVKRTVEEHRGTVTALPGADGGVIFQLEIPLAPGSGR